MFWLVVGGSAFAEEEADDLGDVEGPFAFGSEASDAWCSLSSDVSVCDYRLWFRVRWGLDCAFGRCISFGWWIVFLSLCGSFFVYEGVAGTLL
jgi:hypothetical protein